MFKHRIIRKSSHKLKTLDKVLIILGTFTGLFIIAMIVLFCIYQAIPDTLVIAVLGSGSSEAVLCCIITCLKKKANIHDGDN